ncbi:MAG TPA: dolichyl-phosphate beta-glucosyltransferase [Chthoniobacterales bacterium]|nr:dolichyl-phosphate beta-glucosyltransferase [Chthoniobacterales bacterium]
MSIQIPPSLTLVIPAFNEAARLPKSLLELQKHSSAWDFPYEIIVVVELSSDRTLELAKTAAKTFPEVKVIGNTVHRGKGFAVRTGMLAGRGEMRFFTDSDLSTPLKDLDRAIALFRTQPDIDLIVGSRKHPDSQILQHQSPMRELMGNTFNRFVRALAGFKFLDTQCGFKGFRAHAAREIFERAQIDGFSFDVEVLLLAEAMNFVVMEVPVHWSNSPESKVRVVEDSLRMLQDLFQVRKIVRDAMFRRPFVVESGAPSSK